MYQVILSRQAKKFLAGNLPKHYYELITEHLLALEDDPFPHGVIKMANSEDYRLRVGQYRIIYSVTQSELIVHVIKIGDRKDVYN